MRFFRVQGRKRARRWAGREPRGLMLGGGADQEGVCPRGAAGPGVLVQVQAAAGSQQGRERRSVRAPSSACSAPASSARGCPEPRPEVKKLQDKARPRRGRRTAGALPCELRSAERGGRWEPRPRMRRSRPGGPCEASSRARESMRGGVSRERAAPRLAAEGL